MSKAHKNIVSLHLVTSIINTRLCYLRKLVTKVLKNRKQVFTCTKDTDDLIAHLEKLGEIEDNTFMQNTDSITMHPNINTE